MLTIAEKLAFTNARAVKVCEKMKDVSVPLHENPYLYGVFRNIRHETVFIDPKTGFLVTLLMS